MAVWLALSSSCATGDWRVDFRRGGIARHTASAANKTSHQTVAPSTKYPMSLTQAPVEPSQFLTRNALPVVDHAGSAALKLANAITANRTTTKAISQTIQRRSATNREDAGVLGRADLTRRLPAGRKTKLLMRSIISLFYCAAQQKRRRAFTGRLLRNEP